MLKKDVKKAADNEVVFEMMNAYALLIANSNIRRLKTKALEAKCQYLGAELIERGILTSDQVERLIAGC